jgi:signal transduction histidine kinase/ligand-binding sensor domain-containing protein/DNA-binding response OmpR family regulator
MPHLLPFQRLKCLLFLICLLPWVAGAQIEEARFWHLGEEEGLPERNVTCLLEDSQHLLWIGTRHGLTRYDGLRFREPNPLDSLRTAVISSHIMDLQMDSEGDVWIATLGQGLVRYRKATGRYEVFTHQADNPESLPGNEVVEVAILPSGEIWAATTRGLARWQGNGQRFEVLQHEEGNANSLLSDYLYCLEADPQGNLWAGGPRGMSRIQLQENSTYYFTHYQEDLLPDPRVFCLASGKDGGIWVGMVNAGYGRLDPMSGQFSAYPLPEGVQSPFPMDLQADAYGRLWVCLINDGIFALDIPSGKLTAFRNQKNEPQSLKSNGSRAILAAQNGRWWVGHTQGLSHFRPYDQFFERVYLEKTSSGAESERLQPAQVCEAGADKIYVSSVNGLYRWESKSQNWERVFDPFSLRAYPSDRYHYSMLNDSRGWVWLGTQSKGPVIWKSENQTSWSIDQQMGLIRDIWEDEKGRVWLAVDGKGLGCWQPGQDSLQFFCRPERKSRFPNGRFSAIEKAGEGLLWIGGVGEGLEVFDPQQQKFLKKFQANNSGLSNDFIQDMIRDGQGGTWIATEYGLNYFDPADSSFTSYYDKDGLPGNSIQSLELDQEGRLWIGTDKGLALFDPASQRFRLFKAEDGLADNQLQRMGTCWLGQQLAVASKTGLSLFSPTALPPVPPAPQVMLTGLALGHEPIALKQGGEALPLLSLPPNPAALTLEYAAPGASKPEAISFAYRLEPLETEWNYVAQRPFATYTALPPGEYTFLAQAIRPGEKAGTPSLRLPLEVQPSFVQSTLFKLLIGLLILGVLGAFLWLGKRQLDASHQRELAEQQAAYKSQFLANMSHEIRTPMHSVMSATELLAKTDLEPKQLSYLANIRQAGQNLLSLINDILDFSSMEAGKLRFQAQDFRLQEVLDYVHHTLEPLAQPSQTRLAFRVAPEVASCLNGDPVRLGQILINLMGNGVKYAPGEEVSLEVQPDASGSGLAFRVSDKGQGIPAEELGRIFDSFQRGSSPQLAQQEGVGLGLAITRQLIEQQGGEIEVESQWGKGTTFSFHLPLKAAVAVPSEQHTEQAQLPLPGFSSLLIVEDVKLNRDLAVELLQQAFPEVEILQAESGTDALARLEEGLIPDIVLMDIRMPGMDGIACTREIRKRFSSSLPVLALTASATPEEVMRCHLAGLDGIVAKPFRPEQLFSEIRKALQPAQEPQAFTPKQEVMAEFLGKDPERISRYQASAREEIQKHYRDFRLALGSGENEACRIAAHSLKTTFRYLGVDSLAECWARLEALATEPSQMAARMPEAARLMRDFFRTQTTFQ